MLISEYSARCLRPCLLSLQFIFVVVGTWFCRWCSSTEWNKIINRNRKSRTHNSNKFLLHARSHTEVTRLTTRLTITINQTSPAVSRERRLIVHDDNLRLVCHDCFASTFRPSTLPARHRWRIPSLCTSLAAPLGASCCCRHPLCPLMCSGSICQLRGGHGDKHHSFLTRDPGLAGLSSCLETTGCGLNQNQHKSLRSLLFSDKNIHELS